MTLCIGEPNVVGLNFAGDYTNDYGFYKPFGMYETNLKPRQLICGNFYKTDLWFTLVYTVVWVRYNNRMLWDGYHFAGNVWQMEIYLSIFRTGVSTENTVPNKYFSDRWRRIRDRIFSDKTQYRLSAVFWSVAFTFGVSDNRTYVPCENQVDKTVCVLF